MNALFHAGIAFEISNRYRPHERLVKRAHDRGVRLSLGSDGHTRAQVGDLAFPLGDGACALARRRTPSSILSCTARARRGDPLPRPLGAPDLGAAHPRRHGGRSSADALSTSARATTRPAAPTASWATARSAGTRQRAHASRAHCVPRVARGSVVPRVDRAAAGRQGRRDDARALSRFRAMGSRRGRARGNHDVRRHVRLRRRARSDARARRARDHVPGSVLAVRRSRHRARGRGSAWPRSSRVTMRSRPSSSRLASRRTRPTPSPIRSSRSLRAPGRRIAVHIAESEAEQRFVCDGEGPFADALRARGISVAPRGSLADRAARQTRRAQCAPAPHPLRARERGRHRGDRRQSEHRGALPDLQREARSRHRAVVEMLDAGIAVGLGSDSMAANNRMHLLEESRAAVLAQRMRSERIDALAAAARARARDAGRRARARPRGSRRLARGREGGGPRRLRSRDARRRRRTRTRGRARVRARRRAGEVRRRRGHRKRVEWELLNEDLELEGRVRETPRPSGTGFRLARDQVA